MKPRVLRWCSPAFLVAILGVFPVGARSQPSFDCQKAGNATERRICADPELARLDRELATLWRGMIRSFSNEDQLAQMKADQKQWIARRNECAGDSKCISSRYQAQIDRFRGDDPDYPAAGVFEAEGTGTIALYPSSGKYLVAILTADPSKGSWTCDVSGFAQQNGNALRVTSGDLSFPVTLRDRSTLVSTLVVDQNNEVSAVAERQCGLNGTFAFTYMREETKKSH
jgi:uncharacterized protein